MPSTPHKMEDRVTDSRDIKMVCRKRLHTISKCIQLCFGYGLILVFGILVTGKESMRIPAVATDKWLQNDPDGHVVEVAFTTLTYLMRVMMSSLGCYTVLRYLSIKQKPSQSERRNLDQKPV